MELKEYSQAQLALRNGQDKPEVWIAFQGMIYEVTASRLWRDGKHYEHWAGQDLTGELADAPHTEKVFEKFNVIGKLKKMILIADSGGSKIDWRMVHRNGTITQANCAGFNPYYQPIGHLKKSIEEVLLPEVTEDVTKIFFYGTGVSSEKKSEEDPILLRCAQW